MEILSEIIARKKQRLITSKSEKPFEPLRKEALRLRSAIEPHLLVKALSSPATNVIAEFKRKSPSRGVIRDGVTASGMASLYLAGGAAAISVLTEEDYFAGSLDDLKSVRNSVACPILRKDFIVDEYEVYETAATGADALLLIVAALEDEELSRLRRVAEEELGLDALVEVHTEEEMRRAVASGARLIGVNNRNLKTLEVSLETSVSLARTIPPHTIAVSESGLRSAEDLQSLRALGYKGFLIGESLMIAERPDEALRALLQG
ncbi:MAG: indole-3-glycerol phosphate synthase TrpC [Acidobacteriota bacterium]